MHLKKLLYTIPITLVALVACNDTPSPTPAAQIESRVTVFPAQPTATITSIPDDTPIPTPNVTAMDGNPTSPISTPLPAPTVAPSPTPLPTPTPTLPPHPPEPIRGVNVANSDIANIAPLRDLGFTWVQTFLPPTVRLEPFKVLYRVTLGNSVSGRPEDIEQFADVVEGVAKQNGEFIDAYSVGNEVNLSREWAGQQPDPVLYARLLAIAYARIKTHDPTAIVVSAGIAPTGGDGPGSVDDLNYARAMLNAGAGNAMDAYGFHPYGFAYEPEKDPTQVIDHNGLTFRRAELHRKLMEEFGLSNKTMWATEFGWIVDPKEEGVNCDWPDLNWQKVSRQQQAEYVARAYTYAKQNWPWMERMFLWNYDFSRSPLYPEQCEQMKWFSMLDAQGQPRIVMHELRKVK
jgi:hypothetical protein